MMQTTGVLLTKLENIIVATTILTKATGLLRGVPSTCGTGEAAGPVSGRAWRRALSCLCKLRQHSVCACKASFAKL